MAGPARSLWPLAERPAPGPALWVVRSAREGHGRPLLATMQNTDSTKLAVPRAQVLDCPQACAAPRHPRSPDTQTPTHPCCPQAHAPHTAPAGMCELPGPQHQGLTPSSLGFVSGLTRASVPGPGGWALPKNLGVSSTPRTGAWRHSCPELQCHVGVGPPGSREPED